MQESKADISIGKTSWARRDLLSLLLRANVSADLTPSQRMSDADVLSREQSIFYLWLAAPNYLIDRGAYFLGRWTRDD